MVNTMAEEKTWGAVQTGDIWKQKHRKVMLFWTSLDLWPPLSLAYANWQGTEMLLVEMNLAWTCALTLDSRKPRNHRKAARVWRAAHILKMTTYLLYHRKGAPLPKKKKKEKRPFELDKASPFSSSSNTSHVQSQTYCLQPLPGTMGNQQQWYFLFQNKQVWAGFPYQEFED